MKKSIKRTLNVLCALVFLLAAAITMPLALRKSTALEAYNPSPIVDYTSAVDGSGGGVAGNPWVVKSRNTLDVLVRNNAATANKYFVLGADIDLAGSNWTPITTLAGGCVFDGNNHRISNMTVVIASRGGLFGDVKGTVKNIVMTNVAVTISSSHGGAIAGISTGSVSYFENIMVESGFIRSSTITSTTVNMLGGIVGEISGGRTEGLKLFNAAKIDAGYFAGGIVGHSNGSTTIILNQCANVADIRAYSTSYGYVGGIFGLSEGGSNVTIRNSYNTGSVTSVARDSAGILGCAWSGTALIENCFNNSVLNMVGNRSGICTRNGGTLTIKNCWFNNEVVVPIGGYLVSNNPSSFGTDSGTNTTAQMRQQSFIDKMNAGQDPALFKFSPDGSVVLAAFYPQTMITFVLNDNTSDSFDVFIENEAVTLPTPGVNDFVEPTKIGYKFTGWRLAVGGVEQGNHLNPGTVIEDIIEDTTFIAQYDKVSFEIVFSFDTQGNPSVSSGTSFQIGDSVSLNSSIISWSDDYRWMIQIAGEAESFDLLVPLASQATTLDISALLADDATGRAFLDTYVEYNTAPVAGVVGKLTIKIVNIALVRVVKTATNLPGASSLEFTIVGSGARSVRFGSAISLNTAVGTDVTQIRIVNPNKHYALDSYIVRNATGAQVGAAITNFAGENCVYDSSTDPRFAVANLQNDYTIEAVFTKVQYAFTVSSMLRGTATNLDHLNLTTATLAPITIGDAVSISTHGLLEDASRTYRFAAWKLVDKAGREYYQSSGEQSYDLSIAEIAENWLDQYAKDDRTISIVAEYEMMYRISIDVEASQYDFGNLSIDVIDGITGDKDTYARISNLPIVKGSFITVRASAAEFYQFTNFVGDISLSEMSGSIAATAEFQITAPRTITATFDYRQYTIIYKPFYEGVNNVPGVSGFETYVNGTVSPTLKIGDRINYADETNAIKAPGFEFENFTIFDGTQHIEIPDGTVITREWLLNNLNEINQFVIVANYSVLVRLNLSIAQTSAGMGGLEVYYDGVLTDKREFKEGKDVLIVAQPNPYYKLQTFVGADGFIDNIDGNELTIFSFTDGRTITVRFEKIKFNLIDKITNTAIELLGTSNLTIDQEITLTVDVPTGKQISKWTIGIGNNIIDVKALPGYNGNSATIVLTEQFLNTLNGSTALGFDIYSEVSFAMKSEILMMIIIPCVVVPVLLALFMIYVIAYRKKTSFIKKQLLAEQKTQVTMHADKFIQDLREGKSVGQVTKEDIKKARKNKGK